MRTSKMVRGVKLGFDWQGGMYVNVALGEAFASQTFDVINVAIYKDGTTTYPPFTRNTFHAIVNEWLDDYPRTELLADLRAGGYI